MVTTEDNMQAFGKFLFSLRTEKNAKISNVATALDVHATTISNWEQGKSLPDILALRQLSTLYNVPLDNFLNVLSPTEAVEPSLSPLPDLALMVEPAPSEKNSSSDDENQKHFPSLKAMTHGQQELFILAILMVIVLLIARVFAPLNFILCLGSLFLIRKKALHSGWLYSVIVFCIMSDIYTISGWFLH